MVAAVDVLLLTLSMFAGFLLIFVGVMLLLAGSRGGGGEAKGWGVILIGPLPIVLRGGGVRVAAIVAAIFLLTVLLFLWFTGW
ncbi:hypothetical protein HRbin02_01556 [Candidatus Calditenuaceae archaeon HR02]|nr:hypothetical protein HRbin02_01556 [Candidatus Calditenuaceae archaeon HR02]